MVSIFGINVCILACSKLVKKFQSKSRAHQQAEVRLSELQASMRGLKEQLQLSHQVFNGHLLLPSHFIY